MRITSGRQLALGLPAVCSSNPGCASSVRVGGHKVANTLGVANRFAIELSVSPPILKFLAGHKVENAPLLDVQVKNWLLLDALVEN